jgi:putative FmdB family regulatory protein
MPIYDFQCKDGSCGALFEAFSHVDEMVSCPYCGFSTKRLISASGVNTANQDADWIRSVTEVVDKEGGREAQEFLKRPTRDNMLDWMRAEGIRHYEKGENLRPPKRDMSKVHDHVMREYAARNA